MNQADGGCGFLGHTDWDFGRIVNPVGVASEAEEILPRNPLDIASAISFNKQPYLGIALRGACSFCECCTGMANIALAVSMPGGSALLASCLTAFCGAGRDLMVSHLESELIIAFDRDLVL
jgi:hypothetical protein